MGAEEGDLNDWTTDLGVVTIIPNGRQGAGLQMEGGVDKWCRFSQDVDLNTDGLSSEYLNNPHNYTITFWVKPSIWVYFVRPTFDLIGSDSVIETLTSDVYFDSDEWNKVSFISGSVSGVSIIKVKFECLSTEANTNGAIVDDISIMVDGKGKSLIPVLTGGFASGSDFPIGTTTVTYRVTDASSNSVDCSFDVTVTKENNIAVVDVTGTTPPETDAGITNGGTHCPDLNGLKAVVAPILNPDNKYNPGTSQVQFRVDRLCDTGGDWSFAYQIDGASVVTGGIKLETDSGSATDISRVVSVSAIASYVLFTIDVENIVDTALPIDFTISTGGTNSAIKDAIKITHNLKIIPLIGGFQ